MSWFRASVVRFSRGDLHKQRRARIERLLAALDPDELRERAAVRARSLEDGDVAHEVPAYVLGKALGLTSVPVDAVAAVAADYQSGTGSADAALNELIDAFGGVPDEPTIDRITLLVQAYAATAAMIRGKVSLVTRRVDAATGELIELDLAASGLLFGAGAHACPGRAQVEAIVAGTLSGRV